MAVFQAFRGIRPAEKNASLIAELPYDVYNTAEARARVVDRPLSFLHIDRPEINFPEGMSPYTPEVYNRAHDILWEEIHAGDFTQDRDKCLYLYELIRDGRSQTGIVGLTSVDDYLNGVIKRNEETIERKENDRAHHIDIVNAETGLVYLVQRTNEEIRGIVAEAKTKENLLYNFITEDEVNHKVYRISDPATIQTLTDLYSQVPALYIADGHHRAAGSVRVAEQRRKYNPGYTGQENYNYILSAVFMEDEVRCADYNRVVRDLNDLDTDEFLASILFYADFQPVLELGGMKQMEAMDSTTAMDEKHHEFLETTVRPQNKGEFSVYVGGRWYLCKFHDDVRNTDPVDGLDVSLLQKYIMEEILEIDDPRNDGSIDFVGGSRGLEELEIRCTEDSLAAFAMYPTSVQEMMKVADEGRLMPPKSTWFEPKLLSGLFIYPLEDEK
jgi:uncharacterized protein (DUF1015 family)